MTLATQSAGMKQRDFINQVSLGLKKREVIMMLADEIEIGQ
jgi:hypothetical protein